MEPEHEIAVVEMGINVPGEMERLVRVAMPTVGIITNVHPAHLEGLGSLDRILEEKGKLLSSLGSQGVAAINLDDELLERFSKTLQAGLVTYSLHRTEAMVVLAGPVEVEEGVSIFPVSLERKLSGCGSRFWECIRSKTLWPQPPLRGLWESPPRPLPKGFLCINR